jgi:hypothetical protein
MCGDGLGSYVYVCTAPVSCDLRCWTWGMGVCGMDSSLCKWPEGAALLFLFYSRIAIVCYDAHT